ncbi:unnamed protein product [Amoebophrya sp. A25]|nr:unnamed protein product [Amoebophrya sp. A25]|eukprot:GSA25T00014144001.1
MAAGESQKGGVAAPKPKEQANKSKKDQKKEELNEEDQKLKEELELLVSRACEKVDIKVNKASLDTLADKLKTASSTMTSVPKPLKFLRPSMETMKKYYEAEKTGFLKKDLATKQLFSDILSVLAAVKSPPKPKVDPKKAKEEEEKKKAEEAAAAAKEAAGKTDKQKEQEEEEAAQKAKEEKKEAAFVEELDPYKANRSRECLRYRLEGTPGETFVTWGHEYVRHLAGELMYAYNAITEGEEDPMEIEGEEAVEESYKPPVPDLLKLVSIIVPFQIKHAEETMAIDMLFEVGQVEKLPDLIDSSTCHRVCLYLMASSVYAGNAEDTAKLQRIVFDINMKFKRYPEAQRVALKMKSHELVEKVFEACDSLPTKIQMGYVLRQHRYNYPQADEAGWDDKVMEAYSGENWMKKYYKHLAKELDVLEPKLPEDIYKSHLEEKKTQVVLDSAKQNLASTYVNAFVNAGMGKDKLMTVGEVWLYKNKEHGMMAAAASRSLISLWDTEVLDEVDKYQYASEEWIKAGYFLSLGIALSNCKSETDPVWALLQDTVENGSQKEKIAAIMSLGFAYAATEHEEIVENLTPLIVDVDAPIELSAVCALSVGMVKMGTGDGDICGAIVAALEERMKLTGALDSSVATLFPIALGLIMCGRGDRSVDDYKLDTLFEQLKQITHPLGAFATNLITGFAFAGSGDVLQVQKMMQVAGEHNKHNKDPEPAAAPEAAAGGAGADAAGGASSSSGGEAGANPAASKDDTASPAGGAALLSIAAVAFSDDLSRDMCMRMVEHILQYGNLQLRRTVPLAIGLLFVSNAKQQAIDLLSKLSHDADTEVATAAIVGMGIMGAGTNHAKIAGLLRQLAAYYCKDANILFMVRISQGLLYMGKGLMTLSPVHSDRLLVNNVGMGSLLAVMAVMLNANSLFFTHNMHYLLYLVVPCLAPRMLICVDEEGEVVPVTVRVGAAVDVVGQVGNPKTITGFQTHTTPVLMQTGERAELATDEYVAETFVLDGVVVVRKNPAYKKDTA